ncbi:hypothetical protein GmHk_19G056525 [Glycine max]|nr:hypothetical protein GmHk_19G056525 [Glycine max]RZB49780.1 hypothetical protein D0Y65_052614 [Glycine soja]
MADRVEQAAIHHPFWQKAQLLYERLPLLRSLANFTFAKQPLWLPSYPFCFVSFNSPILLFLMGSNENEGGYYKKSRWITKPSSCLLILFSSLLISIAGASMLGWWLHKYHPSNTQLWMVPFGFLLFLTPLIICLSVILPDLCLATARIQEDQAFKTHDHHALTLPSIQ